MDRDTLSEWLAGYERAWRTADGPELERALATLFAPAATYRTAPFEAPFAGLPAIAAMWSASRQGADEEFTIAPETVAIDADRRVGVLRVEVRYGEPSHQLYRDLWIVAFDEAGRCVAFEEWPFWPPGSAGDFHPGPSDHGK